MAEKKLKLDSPPIEKLASIKSAAKYFHSDLTQLICRDKEGILESVSVFAKGDYAVKLERWLRQIERKEDDTPP